MSGSVKAAGVVAVAVAGSRVFGLFRELVMAWLFGAGRQFDAFLAAFQIPNLLRDLFAEGALSTSFTTVFTQTSEKEGAARSWQLAARLVSTTILLLAGICLLGILLSPWIVALTNPGFHNVPGKFELTVGLTRVLFPFIMAVSLAAVAMGILNSRHIFGLPASASTMFNIVSVVCGVGLAFLLDPQADWRHPRFGDRGMYGVALGVLLGGLAQLAVQLPSLWREGFRWRWELAWRDPGLRRVWRLMVPSVMAGAAVQINVLVNGIFAAEINGGRSWLAYAFRLFQFPLGVFGVAIATVTLPAVARHFARGERVEFGRTVEDALRLALFLALPAAAGLVALAPDLIGVIYQHGRFTDSDTLKTAWALRAYTVGLAGYAVIKVLTPCFYALDQPKIPLRVSLLGVGVNLAVNIVLVKVLGWGHVGLALSTGILASVNGAQLLLAIRRQVSLGGRDVWIRFLAITLLGTLVCGAVAWTGGVALRAALGDGLAARLVSVGVAVAAGALSYGAVANAARLPEMTRILGGIRRHMAGAPRASLP
ncbi:MAG: murein biosynthesis integral membrane protein MurJ [bacterium]